MATTNAVSGGTQNQVIEQARQQARTAERTQQRPPAEETNNARNAAANTANTNRAAQTEERRTQARPIAESEVGGTVNIAA